MNRNIRGFTLVEILIVVIILGILAAITTVKISNARADANEAATRTMLQIIRNQIQLFKVQHNGQLPKLGNNGNGYWKIMIGKSNANEIGHGAGSATGKFGPYLLQIPVNPYNKLSNVGSISNGNQSGNGWAYNENTGEFKAVKADCSGLLLY